MLEVAELIRTIAGSSSPITFTDRPVDDPEVRRPDITLAREALGWEPTVSLTDGLERTLAAHLTAGDVSPATSSS
jgi:dTDP-glucose 4,6-dehydratase